MALEIERKFLVNPERWRPHGARGERFRQGYLSTDPARVVRVRSTPNGGELAVKGPTSGITRTEFQYTIPREDAETLLDTLCVRPIIEKVRYRQEFEGRTWEIDVFEGDNAGLVTAEVELQCADVPVALPPWLADEVSGDPRYFNSNLARFPYRRWLTRGDASGR